MADVCLNTHYGIGKVKIENQYIGCLGFIAASKEIKSIVRITIIILHFWSYKYVNAKNALPFSPSIPHA